MFKGTHLHVNWGNQFSHIYSGRQVEGQRVKTAHVFTLIFHLVFIPQQALSF